MTSLTEVTAVSTTNVRHERKNRYSECYKKVLYAGPKHFDKLKPEPGPKSPARLTTLDSMTSDETSRCPYSRPHLIRSPDRE